jgi:hypothetical protein
VRPAGGGGGGGRKWRNRDGNEKTVPELGSTHFTS